MYFEVSFFILVLESHCKVDSNGYSGFTNVYSSYPHKDDIQQSFFIAETSKYLYLLFSDDPVISLDKWMFNNEGHPLLIMLEVFPNIFSDPVHDSHKTNIM